MTPATPEPTPGEDSLVGAVVGGKYHVTGVLADGGTSRVYRAVQQPLGRPVALKLVNVSGADPEGRSERVFREATAAAALRHPNVVVVHDVGFLPDHRCYIVMELLEGRSLADLLRGGPLPEDRVLELFIQLVRGLRHAHRAGFIHRDIKPANVMIVPGEDGRAVAKLLDFGLVKQLGTADTPAPEGAEGTDPGVETTVVGTFMGTPQYVAPEQAGGEESDGRADIYALGVMLYRALTGVLPFEGDSAVALLVAHLRRPVPLMRERAPGVVVSSSVEAITRRCLQKRPEDRYADTDELLEALLAAAALAEGRAPPPGVPVAGLLPLPMRVDTTEELPPEPPSQPTLPDPTAVVTGSEAGAAPTSTAPTSTAPTSKVPTSTTPTSTTPTSTTPTSAATPANPVGATAAPAPSRRSPLWIALAALLVVGAVAAGFSAGGIAGFYAGTSGGPEASTGATSPPSADAVPATDQGGTPATTGVTDPTSGVTDVAAAPGHEVWLLLSSTPSGATVTMDGEALGTTPLARKVRVTEDSARFALTLPGYADGALTLDVRGDNATGDVPLKHLGGAPKKGSAGGAAGTSAPTPSVVIADGVRFDSAVARKALTWVNTASKEQLLSAGIAPHQANILLETRPYADLGAVAETPFIGEKTVDAIRLAATK